MLAFFGSGMVAASKGLATRNKNFLRTRRKEILYGISQYIHI